MGSSMGEDGRHKRKSKRKNGNGGEEGVNGRRK